MMNLFQRLFAKKEIIKMRRYEIACSELDRWLASDPKAVMIINHMRDYANDKSALRPDKLREQLKTIGQSSDGEHHNKKMYFSEAVGLLRNPEFSDELNDYIAERHQEGLDLIKESERLKKLGK